MKILNFLNFSNLKDNLKLVFSRFNFPFIISVFIFLIFVFVIGFGEEFKRDTVEIIFRINISLIVTFFFSIGIDLLLEQTRVENIKKYMFRVIPLIFGGIFYYFFDLADDFESVVFVALTIAGFISFLFIAGFLYDISKNEYKEKLYYNYFYEISVAFLLSFIFGGVLFLLGVIGIWSVTTLFELDNYLEVGKLIGYWASFSLAFAAPILGLKNLPEKKSLKDDYPAENKFFSFLVKYIALIFIYFYFLVLYGYSLKLLINFGDWPNGEVSWMVIGFSIFGYLVYIFSYAFEGENNFINFYRKYFPYVVIPQIFILFYAIYLRIAQYDLTINRYFVVVFGIWLLVISLYFVFSKEKKLGFIPLILTIFIAIISIGPWSVYELPEIRQFARLQDNLQKAGILKDNGEIVPLKNYDDIDKDLSNNIYSGIDYLCNMENCETIKEYFSEEIKQEEQKRRQEYNKNMQEQINEYEKKGEEVPEYVTREYEGMSDWEVVSFITDYLNVNANYSYGDKVPKYFNIGFDYNKSYFPIALEDYDYMINIYPYESENINVKSGEPIHTKEFSERNEDFYAEVDVDNKTLNLIRDKEILENYSLEGINSQILNTRQEKGQDNFSPSDLTFSFSGEKYDLRVFFDNYTLPNPEYVEGNDEEENSYYYKGVSGKVLVRDK